MKIDVPSAAMYTLNVNYNFIPYFVAAYRLGK